jgi:DNA-directed RNA polymerase specialized sigma24 family protein
MDSRALVDHIPSLRRYARALTGDAWAADDLVQDTLERACSKWRLWTVGSDLRARLFTLMHNLFASQLRRAPPRATVGTESPVSGRPGLRRLKDRPWFRLCIGGQAAARCAAEARRRGVPTTLRKGPGARLPRPYRLSRFFNQKEKTS